MTSVFGMQVTALVCVFFVVYQLRRVHELPGRLVADCKVYLAPMSGRIRRLYVQSLGGATGTNAQTNLKNKIMSVPEQELTFPSSLWVSIDKDDLYAGALIAFPNFRHFEDMILCTFAALVTFVLTSIDYQLFHTPQEQEATRHMGLFAVQFALAYVLLLNVDIMSRTAFKQGATTVAAVLVLLVMIWAFTSTWIMSYDWTQTWEQGVRVRLAESLIGAKDAASGLFNFETATGMAALKAFADADAKKLRKAISGILYFWLDVPWPPVGLALSLFLAVVILGMFLPALQVCSLTVAAMRGGNSLQYAILSAAQVSDVLMLALWVDSLRDSIVVTLGFDPRDPNLAGPLSITRAAVTLTCGFLHFLAARYLISTYLETGAENFAMVMQGKVGDPRRISSSATTSTTRTNASKEADDDSSKKDEEVREISYWLLKQKVNGVPLNLNTVGMAVYTPVCNLLLAGTLLLLAAYNDEWHRDQHAALAPWGFTVMFMEACIPILQGSWIVISGIGYGYHAYYGEPLM
eukprot:Clim_evm20s165 gene=Clim_evmTU20s165